MDLSFASAALVTPLVLRKQNFRWNICGELPRYPPKVDFLTRMLSFSILLLSCPLSIQLITVVFLKKVKYQQRQQYTILLIVIFIRIIFQYYIQLFISIVISCMSGGHGSNKIENGGIRVRKSLFGRYGSNSPKYLPELSVYPRHRSLYKKSKSRRAPCI